jgi:hypothetical protein
MSEIRSLRKVVQPQKKEAGGYEEVDVASLELTQP